MITFRPLFTSPPRPCVYKGRKASGWLAEVAKARGIEVLKANIVEWYAKYVTHEGVAKALACTKRNFFSQLRKLGLLGFAKGVRDRVAIRYRLPRWE